MDEVRAEIARQGLDEDMIDAETTAAPVPVLRILVGVRLPALAARVTVRWRSTDFAASGFVELVSCRLQRSVTRSTSCGY